MILQRSTASWRARTEAASPRTTAKPPGSPGGWNSTGAALWRSGASACARRGEAFGQRRSSMCALTARHLPSEVEGGDAENKWTSRAAGRGGGDAPRRRRAQHPEKAALKRRVRDGRRRVAARRPAHREHHVHVDDDVRATTSSRSTGPWGSTSARSLPTSCSRTSRRTGTKRRAAATGPPAAHGSWRLSRARGTPFERRFLQLWDERGVAAGLGEHRGLGVRRERGEDALRAVQEAHEGRAARLAGVRRRQDDRGASWASRTWGHGVHRGPRRARQVRARRAGVRPKAHPQEADELSIDDVAAVAESLRATL